MTDFHDWEDVRAELHDGDDAALEAERARTLAGAHAYHLAEERRRLGLTQRDVGSPDERHPPGRVSQIEPRNQRMLQAGHSDFDYRQFLNRGSATGRPAVGVRRYVVPK